MTGVQTCALPIYVFSNLIVCMLYGKKRKVYDPAGRQLLYGFSIYYLISQNSRTSGCMDGAAFYILMNLILYLVLKVCFCESGWSRLFVLIGADATQHMAFRIYSVILSFMGIGYEGIWSALLNACIIAIVYLTVFMIFRKQLVDIKELTKIGRAHV